tara:strand:+ start:176 stop:439 length:264 start_codon:yes stop_codon:yes gene_type:complete
MVKEIKYFIFFLVIIIFIFFSIKYYISDENKKKTFRNLSSIDKKINTHKSKLVIIYNDTDNIIKYLNNDKSKNQKKYTFWELLKSEN